MKFGKFRGIHLFGAQSQRLTVYDTDGTTPREEIDSNGFKQVRYRDEFPGGVYQVPAGASAPDVGSYTIGSVATRLYAFDGGTTTETLCNTFEMPHDLDAAGVNAGTYKMEVHVHYMPSDNNAGDVNFYFDWCYIPVNGAAESKTSIALTKTIAANSKYKHYIVGAEMPVPTATYVLGDIILFNVRRVPTDDLDTYGSDVLFLQTALHVPINDFGSRQRYIK